MIYKITIKGHVDNKWSDWFDGLQITHQKDGTTTLYGPLPDPVSYTHLTLPTTPYV